MADIKISRSVLQFDRSIAPTVGIQTQIGKYDQSIGRESNRTAVFEFSFGLSIARPQLPSVRHGHVHICAIEPAAIALVELHVAIDKGDGRGFNGAYMNMPV